MEDNIGIINILNTIDFLVNKMLLDTLDMESLYINTPH